MRATFTKLEVVIEGELAELTRRPQGFDLALLACLLGCQDEHVSSVDLSCWLTITSALEALGVCKLTR